MDTRYTRRRAGKLLQRARSRAAKRKEQPSLFSHAHRGERLARQHKGLRDIAALIQNKGRVHTARLQQAGHSGHAAPARFLIAGEGKPDSPAGLPALGQQPLGSR